MTPETFRYQFRNVLKDFPKISLIGIRGYKYEDGENKIGIYDDAIVRCIDGVIKIFTASVDPGIYYINNPVNPSGCAKLQCGLWKYRLGEHHAHPALVQADEVTVDRLDKTGKRLCTDSGWFGINIHSGGAEYLVGRYSAGCQIIKTVEPWKGNWTEFFLPIFTATQVFEQKTIPYLLVDKLEAIPESS